MHRISCNFKRIEKVFLALIIITSIMLNYKSHKLIMAEPSDALSAEKEQMEEQLKALEAQREEILSKLADYDNELYIISESYEKLQVQVEETKSSIELKEDGIKKLEEKISEQREGMKKRIQYSYENSAMLGNLNISLIFENPVEFINSKDFTNSFLNYDRTELENYTTNLGNLTASKEQLESDYDSLTDELTDLENYKEQMLAAISENDTKLTDIETKTSDTESRIAEIIDELYKFENKWSYVYKDELSLEEQYAIIEESEGSSGRVVYPQEGEEELLAAIIYCEAGAENYDSQLGVGSVVLNRVNNSAFANTITDVIYSPKQFTPVGSGRLSVVIANNLTSDSCRRAAHQVLNDGVIGNWLYFRVNDGSRLGVVIDQTVFY